MNPQSAQWVPLPLALLIQGIRPMKSAKCGNIHGVALIGPATQLKEMRLSKLAKAA
jgi:hypothetical protein